MFRDLRQTSRAVRDGIDQARTDLHQVTESIDRATEVIAVVVFALCLVSAVSLLLSIENANRINRMGAR